MMDAGRTCFQDLWQGIMQCRAKLNAKKDYFRFIIDGASLLYSFIVCRWLQQLIRLLIWLYDLRQACVKIQVMHLTTRPFKINENYLVIGSVSILVKCSFVCVEIKQLVWSLVVLQSWCWAYWRHAEEVNKLFGKSIGWI